MVSATEDLFFSEINSFPLINFSIHFPPFSLFRSSLAPVKLLLGRNFLLTQLPVP